MSAQRGVVKAIYRAFGERDVPAMLALLAEDVVWEYGFADLGVPWLRHRQGRAGAAEFLSTLHAELEVLHFRPKAILEGEGLVVVLADLEARVRRNGFHLQELDEVHLWHFGPDGLVHRFRHVLDTAQHLAAWRA